MNQKPPFMDDNHRYALYEKAMNCLASNDVSEKNLWQQRLVVFRANRTSKRSVWLNWVEKCADSIPWCEALVVKAVSLALIGSD